MKGIGSVNAVKREKLDQYEHSKYLRTCASDAAHMQPHRELLKLEKAKAEGKWSVRTITMRHECNEKLGYV